MRPWQGDVIVMMNPGLLVVQTLGERVGALCGLVQVLPPMITVNLHPRFPKEAVLTFRNGALPSSALAIGSEEFGVAFSQKRKKLNKIIRMRRVRGKWMQLFDARTEIGCLF